jgi:hypothetical protein
MKATEPVGDDGSATLEEVRRVLHDAADLRMPARDPEQGRAQWIEALQDYLLDTARMRGDLESARLLMHETLRTLDSRWETMTGYQVGHNLKSRADHDRAKLQANPGLHDARREAKFLVDRLSEQIERLGGMSDDQIVSRIYSMFG